MSEFDDLEKAREDWAANRLGPSVILQPKPTKPKEKPKYQTLLESLLAEPMFGTQKERIQEALDLMRAEDSQTYQDFVNSEIECVRLGREVQRLRKHLLKEEDPDDD